MSVPYRAAYQAGGLQTGLQGIYAMVLTPDGQQLGPYPMTEGAELFSGMYFFTYYSLLTDVQGEYMIKMFSPQENVESASRMSLYLPPPGLPPTGVIQKALVRGLVIAPVTIVGRVMLEDPIVGEVLDNVIDANMDLDGSVLGTVNSETLQGDIYEQLP